MNMKYFQKKMMMNIKLDDEYMVENYEITAEYFSISVAREEIGKI